MLITLSSQVLLPVPGPFACFAGRDGVDETFDVFCLETDRHIVSTYYWYAREESRVIADVVAIALNRLAGHDIHDPADADDIATFQGEYPGAYSVRKNRCDGRGPCFEVYCQRTNAGIIDRYGRSRFDRQVTRAIAEALNQLSSHA